MDPIDWWRTAVIYQIYPRSFADSNGDGVGDLNGITDRLDAWLSLGHRRGLVVAVLPLAAGRRRLRRQRLLRRRSAVRHARRLRRAAARAHDLGLRVIIDLVPNHTLDRHPWFEAGAGRGAGRPSVQSLPVPRDRSRPTGSRSSAAAPGPQVPDGQWYLHLYDVSQPDLNWAQPTCGRVRAGAAILARTGASTGSGSTSPTAWSRTTVLPFRTADAPLGVLAKREAPYWDQDGVHDIYRSWRALLDGYTAPTRSRPRVPVRRGQRLGAAHGPLRAAGRDAPGLQLPLSADALGRRGRCAR